MMFNAPRWGEVSKLLLKHWVSAEDERRKRRTDLALEDPVEIFLAE